jgi:hypothetical protein
MHALLHALPEKTDETKWLKAELIINIHMSHSFIDYKIGSENWRTFMSSTFVFKELSAEICSGEILLQNVYCPFVHIAITERRSPELFLDCFDLLYHFSGKKRLKR